MAIQTKRHTEMFLMSDLVHFVNPAVALHAAYTTVNMHRVVEINVIRQLVNLHPLNGLVRILVTGPDRLKLWVIGPDRAVAVHTGVSRRHV